MHVSSIVDGGWRGWRPLGGAPWRREIERRWRGIMSEGEGDAFKLNLVSPQMPYIY